MDISNVADDIKTIEQEHTAEEEAANRAAAELQERKRRKKRRNRILTVIVILLIIAGVVAYQRYQTYLAAQADTASNVLELADGEELTYGEITQVVGNDITVAVVVEDTSAGSQGINAKAPGEDAADSGDDSNANISMTEDAQADGMPAMPDGDVPGNAPSGEMPSGDAMPDSATSDTSSESSEDAAPSDGMPSGMPSGGADGMPSMPSGGDGGSMPSGGSGSMPSMPGGASGTSGSAASPMNQTQYTETGETKEYEIPVGTDVTTMLGATTTFAKLKTGNVIGIVTEAGTDNILRIKIVQ